MKVTIRGAKIPELRVLLWGCAVPMAAVALAACGSTSSGGSSTASGSKGLPSTIKIYAIEDLTGPAGFAGIDDVDALKLAVSDINSSGMLGKSKIVLTTGDSQSLATQGATLAEGAIGQGYAAIIGGPDSVSAQGEAPVLARAKQVVAFTQAGSSGVLINGYTFRLTPLQTDQIHLTLAELQKLGIKSVATITAADVPTDVQLNQTVTQNASKYGYTVKGQVSVTATQSDVAAAVSKLVSTGAQSVGMFVGGAQGPTVVTELRQDGYKGTIWCEESCAGGTGLSPAGSAANGVFWATDWAAPGTTAISKSYAAAYQKAYGQPSSDDAAEAFDALYYIADALKMAGSTNQARLDAAMIKLGNSGTFSGVLGAGLKVTNGQEYTPGYLVRWSSSAKQPVLDNASSN